MEYIYPTDILLKRGLPVKPYKGEYFLNIPTGSKALRSDLTNHRPYSKAISIISIVHRTK